MYLGRNRDLGPSKHYYSSLLLVLKKNQKDCRFYHDMRNVNKVTTIDSYPLLRIDNTLDALNGSKLFFLR